MARHVFPPERTVVLSDPRKSRWDGCVAKVCAGPRLERGCTPGEIGVFTPTGEEREVTIIEEFRTGPKSKVLQALVYRRTGTRLVSVLPKREASPRPLLFS